MNYKFPLPKNMKVRCPHCFKKFDWGLTSKERKIAFDILLKDKEFMRKVGKEVAKNYIINSSTK